MIACTKTYIRCGVHRFTASNLRRCDCVLQLDIKALLTRVYGLEVEKVRTLNVEGKKKKTKYGYFRKPDWKKAYVTMKPPTA